MSFELLVLINFIATAYMAGVIWVIQAVHYKLYDMVGEDGFTEYQNRHIKLITPVVAPMMIIELVSSTYLYLNFGGFLVAIAFGLVVIIWLNTVLQAIPTHRALSLIWEPKLYKQLLGMNWIRTIAWTIKLGVMALLVYELLL